MFKTPIRPELHQTKMTKRCMRTTRERSPSSGHRIANTTHLSTKPTKPDVRQVEKVRDEGKLLCSIFGAPPLEEDSERTAAVAPAVFVGAATTDDAAVTAGIGAELAWSALSSTDVAVLIEVGFACEIVVPAAVVAAAAAEGADVAVVGFGVVAVAGGGVAAVSDIAASQNRNYFDETIHVIAIA
ncbi:unnamed protein product [Angiostrongylus costaricensis]|uniref:Uncharacterized protein n=1 Tax=Angiostrongylus costaricensis TaxID=334426 RepID=A0A158PFY3_ANGCS|nr:unnamed protein product [Angiostrongylus costaricensis]